MGRIFQDTTLTVGSFTREFTVPPGVVGDFEANIVAEYDAVVRFFMKQTGSVAKGLKIVDTRQCSYWMKGWIEQQYIYETPNGVIELPVSRVARIPSLPGETPKMSSLEDFFRKDNTLEVIGALVMLGGYHDPCPRHVKKFRAAQPKFIAAAKAYLSNFDGQSPFSFLPEEMVVDSLESSLGRDIPNEIREKIKWDADLIKVAYSDEDGAEA